MVPDVGEPPSDDSKLRKCVNSVVTSKDFEGRADEYLSPVMDGVPGCVKHHVLAGGLGAAVVPSTELSRGQAGTGEVLRFKAITAAFAHNLVCLT